MLQGFDVLKYTTGVQKQQFQTIGSSERQKPANRVIQATMMNSREFALKLNKYVGLLEKVF